MVALLALAAACAVVSAWPHWASRLGGLTGAILAGTAAGALALPRSRRGERVAEPHELAGKRVRVRLVESMFIAGQIVPAKFSATLVSASDTALVYETASGRRRVELADVLELIELDEERPRWWAPR